MGDKVVVEGKLCGWQSSPLHVGISVNDPTIEGDWAALSGRRVRVTVEVVKAVDRLAGCKCKRCGHELSIRDYRKWQSDVERPCAVWCDFCCMARGPYAKTPAAAIDAYLAQQKPEPEPRCPHCGGELWFNTNAIWESAHCAKCGADGVGPTRQAALDALKAWQPELPKCPHCGGVVRVNGPFVSQWVKSKYEAFCTNWAECDAGGGGETRQAALDALAEWLAPCPRCGGKAEYLNNGREGVDLRYWVICRNDECSVHSFQFTTKPAAAQWWNKREGRHG